MGKNNISFCGWPNICIKFGQVATFIQLLYVFFSARLSFCCRFTCFQLRFLPLFLCLATWFSHSLFPLHFSSLFRMSVCAWGVAFFSFFSCTTISLFALCFRGELILHFRSFNCIFPPLSPLSCYHVAMGRLKVPWSCFGRRKFIWKTGNRSESHMNFPGQAAGHGTPLGRGKRIIKISDSVCLPLSQYSNSTDKWKRIQFKIYFTVRNGYKKPQTQVSLH